MSSILFDNAGQFAATRNDDTWNKIADLNGPQPALRVAVPGLEHTAPYWWTSRPHVEGGFNRFQGELTSFLAGRKTKAERLDGTDAHAVGSQYLLPWQIGVGLVLRTVEKLNHTFMPALEATPAEYYAANHKGPRRLPDEAVAQLYQPHYFRDGMRTVVPDKGVQIDGTWWTGDGLDFDFDSDWRVGKGPRAPRRGDQVEVRVPHHRHDPQHYLPKRDAEGKLIPVDPHDPGPLGRHVDRAAIMFEGHFTGWVYPKATPETVRHSIVLNRVATATYIQRLQRSNRVASRILAEHIEATGEVDLDETIVDITEKVSADADATREAEARAEKVAEKMDAAAGQDSSGARRPGKRPPTRTGRKAGQRPPAEPQRRPGFSALADAQDAANEDDVTGEDA